MSKYDPLKHHLSSLGLQTWTPRFTEIEEILGFRLPASARSYQAWWANDSHHSYASTWLDIGWRTESLDLGSERVTFRRSAGGTRGLGMTSPTPSTPAIDLSPHSWDGARSVECKLGFCWNSIGRVQLDGSGRLTFPDAPPAPAIYRFRIRSGTGEALYIGETENLARRLGFYRNPGPSQQTNLRMNARFREALSSGAEIAVAAILADAWIELGGTRQPADLSSKAVRCLLENAAIVDGGGTAVESLNKASIPR